MCSNAQNILLVHVPTDDHRVSCQIAETQSVDYSFADHSFAGAQSARTLAHSTGDHFVGRRIAESPPADGSLAGYSPADAYSAQILDHSVGHKIAGGPPAESGLSNDPYPWSLPTPSASEIGVFDPAALLYPLESLETLKTQNLGGRVAGLGPVEPNHRIDWIASTSPVDDPSTTVALGELVPSRASIVAVGCSICLEDLVLVGCPVVAFQLGELAPCILGPMPRLGTVGNGALHRFASGLVVGCLAEAVQIASHHGPG